MTLVSLPELITGAKQGKVVSFPTDTVYALAVSPENAQNIFQLKQREAKKPLILMGASSQQLWRYVQGNDREFQIWQAVANHYFPGALTLVLPSSSEVPRTVNPETPDSIGIRVPNSAIALSIFEQTGVLATTSANRSGEPPLTSPEAINERFPEVLVLADEAAETPNSLPSTVVKWMGESWTILRQGNLPFDSGVINISR
ncbi:L-threonylcarbamoyladenylate synthase [Euhalothece natronophila Z-M001]|uniref:L-threonylcarbamoyladenylate synthase n=1 Tax=Euhalothece natronophila Z-M001 TaxID=522448 RepID=A0A5B8NL71_9CHRO|nr:L-threonylcarbamoyladenylate synthase [Euhalothece natronophila]QDZ39784.1 L-threonylcarbamoyladenylate synthase [Euhalothece natronophila Z-M001]